VKLADREIEVTITEGKTGKVWTLSGYRVQCAIAVLGGPSSGTLQCRIFGMPISRVNELTAIGSANPTAMGQNKVQIAAGETGGTLSTIFVGDIFYSWGDYTEAPNVSFNIHATPVGFAGINPVPPTSIAGPVQLSTVFAGMAALAGVAFVNHGVTAIISNQYYPGTALQQIRRCALANHVAIDLNHGTLTIWPAGTARPGEIPILTPQTGLVGYPLFTMNYIQVRSLFLPTIQLGGVFEVQGSAIKAANGQWRALGGVVHNLESQMPNGQWFTDLEGWANVSHT
jgi:hypothetical protein